MYYCKDVIIVAAVDAWRQSIANPGVNLFEILLADMVSRLSGADLSALKKAYQFASFVSGVLNELFGGEDAAKRDAFHFWVRKLK